MLVPDEVAPQTIRRLARHEYERMVELGMFEDERLELLRGVLVTMSPQGEPHSTMTAWLAQSLSIALGLAYDVRSHSPLAATDDSEPEPDVSVSKRVQGTYYHPTTALLVIEVSDSSLRKDRKIKTAIYAEAGCAEYWIVDISGDELVVEVHRDPTPTGYAVIEKLRAGDVLRPSALPAVEIRVDEIPWY
jgi:Uma2 family endonuclease